MVQSTLDAALAAALPSRPMQCRDHSYPGLSPRADCAACRAWQEYVGRELGSRCQGSGRIADQVEILSRSPYWRARAACPVCGKRVSATRSTKRHPWNLIGAHN